MRSFLRAGAGLLFLLIGGAWPAFSQNANADYLGPWRQIQSNAGSCGRCEITFDYQSGNRNSISLVVRANNGWSAIVRLSDRGSKAVLAGEGAWAGTLASQLRGKSFDVTFSIVENKLHMDMRIRSENTSSRVIRATFLRHWVGS